MKTFLIFFTLFLSPLVAKADQQLAPLPLQNCAAQVPWGWPQASIPNSQGICRNGYVLLHDNSAKIPVWVAYTLTPQHAIGCEDRSNAFAADRSLPPTGRSTPTDYVGTGYDQGHQAPDGDMSWNPVVEHESFIMSNIAPQLPGLNRAVWKLLESSIRVWAYELNQPFTIYVGPIYNLNDPRIGNNGVVVPHAFYKIVIDDSTHQVAGWIMPNQQPLPNDLTKFRASVADIQKLTGVQFLYPPNSVELPVGEEWPVDFGAFTRAKRSACGASSN